MTAPKGQIREEEEEGNENLAFHTKAISFSLLRSSSVIFLAMALSLSVSPSLSMPKIHRMKEERGRERSERGEKWEKGED